MSTIIRAPFLFAWAALTGTAFIAGFFVWVLIGTACAGAIVAGAALSIFYHDGAGLWLVAIGMTAGAMWSALTDAFAELLNR